MTFKHSRNRLRAAGAALVAAVGLACAESEASDAPTVATAEVIRTNMRITAEATGLVEPIRTIEVKSKASGEILQLHVDIGDRVEEGTLLAEVDPRDVRNAYEQAQADLIVAEARVEITQAQFNRSKELLAAGVITQQEHEGTNLEMANANSQLVKAQTNLELATLRLGDVTIRAPQAGTIISKSVEEGQVIQSASGNVSGGTTLFLMANLDDMQVRTLVDETDVGQLRPGLEAAVTVEAFPDRTFMGRIEKIEPQAQVEQNVTMFPVIVMLDNRAGLLRPGMNAEVVVLVAEQPDVLTIPNNAVVEPRQMAVAAEVLGVDPNTLPNARDRFTGRAPNGEGRSEAALQTGRATADGASASGSSPAGGFAENLSEESRARTQAIREQVQTGEITQDSARVLLAAARRSAMESGGQSLSASPGAGEPSTGRRTGQPGVAFIVKPDGSFEARFVTLGLSDWDQTEVMNGLEEGEQVAIVGAAQLLAQQQEFMNRIRDRTGGSPFGGRR
jgi:HlyD family secretion protein